MAREVEPDLFLCPGCEETKPRSDYYAPKTKHTGVAHYCKACSAKLRRHERKGVRAFQVRDKLR